MSHGLPFFLLALLAGLLAHFAGFMLFRVRTEPAEVLNFPKPFVQYLGKTGASNDPVLREQALLFDTEPLFLPTPWNFAAQEGRRAPVGLRPLFDAFAVDVAVSESDFHLRPPVPASDLNTLALLRVQRGNSMGTFGQAPALTAALPARGARLSVTRLDARAPGVSVLEEDLPTSAAPPAGDALWGPTTFLLLFSAGGPVGAPILTNSSGNDTVDQYWHDQLDDRFRHHPLPPGTYQIVVGP